MKWKFSKDFYTHRIFPWCVFLVSCFSPCPNSVLWWQRAWNRKWRKWCSDLIDKYQFTTRSNQLPFVVFGNIYSSSHIRILKNWCIWSRSWLSLSFIYAYCNTGYSVFRFQHPDAEYKPYFSSAATCSSCFSAFKAVVLTNVTHTFYFDIPESEKSLLML